MNTPRITVGLDDETLTDGSVVFAALIKCEDTGNTIRLEAASYQHAYELADDIATAINKHTNLRAEWR